MNEVELEGRLFPLILSASCGKQLGEADFEYLHGELQRPGVTLQLLWEEYLKEHSEGYRYSQFCRPCRELAQRMKAYMRQVHKWGEKVYVDYSWKKLHLVDARSGEVREVELFVMAWAASHCIYAEAQENQTLPTGSWGMYEVLHTLAVCRCSRCRTTPRQR